MPISVNEVLNSVEFVQRITVIRRTQTIGANGRSVLTPQTFANISAVVEPGGASLARGADRQEMPNPLNIWTTFRLRGPSPGFQPDLVVWHGDSYVVDKTNDFSDYGPGYIQAECSSIDSIDTAEDEPETDTI